MDPEQKKTSVRQLSFTKMNGAGNDFIIFDNTREALPDEAWPDIALTVCERHLSLGADGIMVVDRPTAKGLSYHADYRMTYYNSDGSLGEMCGNGARCICRYGYEKGYAKEVQTIETTAGKVTGTRISENLYRIRLNDPSVLLTDYPVTDNGITYECAYAELGCPGIPHAVIPIDRLSSIFGDEPGACTDSSGKLSSSKDKAFILELGRRLRYNPAFVKGANINFYEITGPDEIYEKTYERGVEDFTYACGTGTGSLVAALTLKGLVSGKDVKVNMRGGQLIVSFDPEENSIFLTGPTKIAAEGTVYL